MPHHHSLYQINTRAWLTDLAATLGRPATLDDIPDVELDRLAAMASASSRRRAPLPL